MVNSESKPVERISKDDYFYGIAKAVSLRATCPRRSVGAILVSKEGNRILTTGYNGAPAGGGDIALMVGVFWTTDTANGLSMQK